jgi:hypothetical protein
VAEPGASLYNSYHLLTQISGLYGAAAGFDPDPASAAVWRELCDSAIADLGEIYLTWELSLAEARAGRAVMIPAAVGSSVVRACQRAQIFTTRLNIWTPMCRWINVMSLAERRWQRQLASFAAASPVIREKLAPVATSGKDRISRLVGLGSRYRPPVPPSTPKAKPDETFAIEFDDDLAGGKVGA